MLCSYMSLTPTISFHIWRPESRILSKPCMSSKTNSLVFQIIKFCPPPLPLFSIVMLKQSLQLIPVEGFPFWCVIMSIREFLPSPADPFHYATHIGTHQEVDYINFLLQ